MIVTYYPPNINERFLRPGCVAKIAGANAVGTGVSFECGCFVRLSLRIDVSTKKIVDAGFVSNGCGFMIAAADCIAGSMKGRELPGLGPSMGDEIGTLVESAVGTYEGRHHCLRTALDALHACLSDHRAYLLEEFSGEKALICTCFGVAEETIERFIADHTPGSVEEVTRACRAGGGCGSCRMLIQEMLDERGF